MAKEYFNVLEFAKGFKARTTNPYLALDLFKEYISKYPTDYFKVITLINSSYFITMYPVIDVELFPYVDLNYLRKEEPVKVKRISQIDKFNQRYHR